MIRLGFLTVLTLFAFAGNSLLNRMALADSLISAEAYAAIRLGGGALALGVIVTLSRQSLGWLTNGTLIGAVSLAVYAIGFSYGYLRIDAGLGALLLFGVVQVTMFAAALAARQEAISVQRWIGTGIALAGLALLLLPGSVAPSPLFAAMMITSAIAWGFYTLAGKNATNPLASTAANFVYAAVAGVIAWWFVTLVPAAGSAPTPMTAAGVGLALTSGIVTSGMGYALWYLILPQLRTTTAALAQVTVPVITAVGGVILLGETVTATFIIAAALVLAGVAFSLRR